MISDYKKKKQEESQKILNVMQEHLANSKADLGSHNKVKLKNALALANKFELEDQTLLTPSVHADHHEIMKNSFMRHWQVNLKAGSELSLTAKEIADQHYRFFTLINSIELVDEKSALDAANAFKENLIAHIEQVDGIECLGSIEIEVVSFKHMRRFAELNEGENGEQRKLDVCEKLLVHSGLDEASSPNLSFLLVHFHGILFGKKSKDFDQLNSVLRTSPQWGGAPRQIEIKKLSTQFSNKTKSMEDNLSDIARYITKGGNDWVGKRAYLRYKLGFEQNMNLNMEEWESLNWRQDEALKLENKENGITDMLSLTYHEIATLASLIYSLMMSNPNTTGYQIKLGNW
jgi:hypothetical protein